MKQTNEQTKNRRTLHSVSFFSTNLKSDFFLYDTCLGLTRIPNVLIHVVWVNM